MKTAPYALWVWYRGTRFRGYQRQLQGPTVQEAIEQALAACGVKRTPSPSGRTDQGVHARMQILSVKAPALPLDSKERLNAALAPDIGVCALRPARKGFHAQWSARGKEYRYRLQLQGELVPAWRPYAWSPSSDDGLAGVSPERLRALLSRCVGTRDFIAFHEKSSARRLRTLELAALQERGDGLFEVRLAGSGFGRYQVRYLVGTAVAVAAGRLSEDAFVAALEEGVEIRGLRAPARGLTLWEVRYDEAMDPFHADRAHPGGLPTEPPFV